MAMDSIYKLSVVLDLVNHLTSPLKTVEGQTVSTLDKLARGFDVAALTGTAMASAGTAITGGMVALAGSTFETQDALAELRSLGVADLAAIENAAKSFSDTWAGTTKSEFISAAYDIKSGISSLTDEGVAQFTELSALTAKATKSTAGEMTSLFATGYGIYKDYYGDLSDLEFGEIFSAGIATAVRDYKTSGSQMAASISTLGASATTANVPFEEQLSILGMLQATMSGSEAGTKYKAFINAAAGAGDALKLSFVDANKQMLSMPEILAKLKSKYGDTLDAIEKQDIKSAFGSDEAVAVIDLLYGKTDTLETGILGMYESMGKGKDMALEMATAINSTEHQKLVTLQQSLHNVSEELGSQLLPNINIWMDKGIALIARTSDWIGKNKETASTILNLIMYVGIFLTVLGTFTTVFGVVGGTVTRVIGMAGKLKTALLLAKDGFTTLRIYGMYAGDGIKAGFGMIKTASAGAVTAIKNVSLGILSFAKQAIVSAVQALPGLIASVWSFTAALLANPVTWIVIGVVALAGALIALWMNWDKVSAWLQGVWNGAINGVINGFNWLKDKLASVPNGFLLIISAAMPFIGIPLLIIKNWDTIVVFFQNLPETVRTFINDMINKAKEAITGANDWFRESGAKILDTFTEGIKSAISKPVEAVKGGLAKIRKMLPFSDAKEGPLSTLTLSGRRVFETITTGMDQTASLPAEITRNAFSDAASNVEDGEENWSNVFGKSSGKAVEGKAARQSVRNFFSSAKNETDNGTVIQKLELTVDLNNIKDLPLLFNLLEEIKASVNGGSKIAVKMA